MVRVPPFGMASRAFTTRFISTCSIWPGSALTIPRSGRSANCKSDRKGVVEGKSVDLGGPRIIKKKKFNVRSRPGRLAMRLSVFVSGVGIWQLSFCLVALGAVGDCFFFQAEDGIRDYKVTGVQTCALPIYKIRVVYAGDSPRQKIRLVAYG